MTLDEQIGQALIVGFPGTTVTGEVADLIARHRIGGVILFSRNVHDAGQVRALTGDLQALARAAGHRRPLLVAIDEENGVVRRLGADATIFPGNMALGAIGSEEVTRAVARAAGRELAALGITMNLAPVVDINTNPANPVIGVRSFGEDPAEVARLGAAAVRGYEAGVLPCLKHFPGHGDTAVDSHLALPTLAHTMERLDAVELAPFRAGIAAGAPAVMVAHVALPHLAPGKGLPSTVAPAVVRGLLREHLGFDGAILSDCLEMDAVAGTVGVERGAVMALGAGVDLVFVSHRLDRQRAAIAAIGAAIEDGTLPRETVRQAAEHVLRLKAHLPSPNGPASLAPAEGEDPLAVVGCEAHRALARDAYERAITLVRDDDGLVPLRLGADERLLLVYPRHEALSGAEEDSYPTGFAVEPVRRRHPRVDAVAISARPDEAEHAEVLRRAAGAGAIVAVTASAHRFAEQANLVRELIATGRPVIGVAARDPYDLLAFPALRAYLCAYEYTPPAMEAAARVLFGEIPARGHLPVSLPGLYDRGHSLTSNKPQINANERV